MCLFVTGSKVGQIQKESGEENMFKEFIRLLKCIIILGIIEILKNDRD